MGFFFSWFLYFLKFFDPLAFAEVVKMSGKGKGSGGGGGGKMSKEDELLLADFSRGVSAKSSALFYGNSIIVSSIPVWLYWRVHNLDPAGSALILAVAILVSTWLIAFAYRNTKYLLKHKIAVKRESAVTKEMNAKLADDKKISRKEKDERILWKKNEVAEYESTTFAIFYNNALFLSVLIFASFYVFPATVSPTINYVASMGISAGLIALLSTGTAPA